MSLAPCTRIRRLAGPEPTSRLIELCDRQIRFGSPEVAKLAGYVITSVTVKTFEPFGAVEM